MDSSSLLPTFLPEVRVRIALKSNLGLKVFEPGLTWIFIAV